MTLIAGFKATDGVGIVCDRQHTTERIKYFEPKFRLFPAENVENTTAKAVIGMAGDGASALMLTQVFIRKIEDAEANVSIDALRETLRQLLIKYYREHVACMPSDKQETPSALTVALWTKTDGLSRLFYTDRTHVVEVDDCDFRGTGADWGRAFTAPVYTGKQNLSDSTPLLASALLKAQKWDIYTGGGIDIITLSHDGTVAARQILRPDTITKALAEYEQQTNQLQFALVDASLDATAFESKVNEFVAGINDVRQRIVKRKSHKRP